MQATASQSDKQKQTSVDFLPLQGTDYVEFYVGNAKQAAHFYKTAFGFQSLAYAGPETGVKDKASYVIRQNKLTFVLTTPVRANNEIADHIYKHGDGVKVIALKVDDATIIAISLSIFIFRSSTAGSSNPVLKSSLFFIEITPRPS